MKLKVGRVNTPFHSLALKVKTTVDVMEEGLEARAQVGGKGAREARRSGPPESLANRGIRP